VKMGGPAIHGSILAPLLVMAAGFTAFYVVVLIVRMRAELVARKLRALHIAEVQRHGGHDAHRAGAAAVDGG